MVVEEGRVSDGETEVSRTPTSRSPKHQALGLPNRYFTEWELLLCNMNSSSYVCSSISQS